MEYTLTIRQVAINKYFPSLDIKDAAILDFLGRFAQAKGIEKKFVGQTVFYWFDYKKISAENPLLRLNYEAMRKRMANLCKLGILESHPANKGGKVFFAFGENHEKTHRIENVDAYEASAKERNAKAEVGTGIPKQEKQVGTQIPRGRYADTEVLPKGRYQNTDNQYNHSNQNTIISNTNSENEFSPTTDDDAAQYFTVETHEPPKREVMRLEVPENAKTSNGARRDVLQPGGNAANEIAPNWSTPEKAREMSARAWQSQRDVLGDEFADVMATQFGAKIVTVQTAEPIPESLGKPRKAKRPSPPAHMTAWRPLDVEVEIESLKSDYTVKEAVTLSRKVPAEKFDGFVGAFALEVRTAQKPYPNRAEFRAHFLNFCAARHRAEQKEQANAAKPVNKAIAQQQELGRGLAEYYANKRLTTLD